MSDQQYQEIWAETPDGQAMCALVNGDHGWLMYLRRTGDAGFSSRSPNFIGPRNAVFEYVLSNGSVTNTRHRGQYRKSILTEHWRSFAENASHRRSFSGTTIPEMA